MQKNLKQILVGLFTGAAGTSALISASMYPTIVFFVSALLMAFISKLEDVKSLEVAKFEDTLRKIQDEVEALKIVSQMRRAPL